MFLKDYILPRGNNHNLNVVRFRDDEKVRNGSKIETGNAAFMVLGSKLMECHQGPRHRSKMDRKAGFIMTERFPLL